MSSFSNACTTYFVNLCINIFYSEFILDSRFWTSKKEKMSCIKSLDKTTVHRICSGQVIINLANGVKELIENSLDAGAKTIEIRLKNYGSDSIEVIDDGPGIDEQDFQAVSK